MVCEFWLREFDGGFGYTSLFERFYCVFWLCEFLVVYVWLCDFVGGGFLSCVRLIVCV